MIPDTKQHLNAALIPKTQLIGWNISTRRYTRSGRKEFSSTRKLRFIVVSMCLLMAIMAPTYLLITQQKYTIRELIPTTKEQGNSSIIRDSPQLHTKNQTDFSLECKDLKKPEESDVVYRHKYWQAYTEADKEEDIVVYSAFYDDRPIVGDIPWIRILGVRRLSSTPLWCYVWYSNRSTAFVTNAEIIANGAVQQVMGNIRYSQNMFSCRLNSNQLIPTHVSLTTKHCSNSSIFLPITRPEKPPSGSPPEKFGACLEVNFGYFPPELIVEWMEAVKLFGVTQVTVYNGSIDSRLDKVFGYYVKKGLLDLYQMPPPVNDYGKPGVRLASPASLNDCMMRRMYTDRFLVVKDFDEVIVPRINITYQELVAKIDRKYNLSQSFHTYSFRNAYFFTYFPEDVTQPVFLKTLRLRYRTKPCGYLFGTKSFIDPRQCKSLFNHYCWVRFEHDTPLTIDVDTSLALSQHYRSVCPFDKKTCEQYKTEKFIDDVMLQYKSVLFDRVSAVLKYVGIV